MRASREELKPIKAVMNSEKNVRVFKRYQALYLFLSGKTREEVAEVVGLSPNTVSNIHRAYKLYGLEGIPDKPIPGRPAKLTEEQQAQLKEVILSSNPADESFSSDSSWTAGLIGKFIEREYGYKYSIRGITKMLGRMGLTHAGPISAPGAAQKQRSKKTKQTIQRPKRSQWTENSMNTTPEKPF